MADAEAGATAATGCGGWRVRSVLGAGGSSVVPASGPFSVGWFVVIGSPIMRVPWWAREG